MKKLYYLKPKSIKLEPWQPWYDKAFGFVVRAESPDEARLIASQNAGEEDNTGYYEYNKRELSVWCDEKYTECIELTGDGESELILRDIADA